MRRHGALAAFARRRRFDDGGAVDGGVPDDSLPLPPPEPPEPDQVAASPDAPPPGTGALVRAGQQADPDAAAKAARMDQAMMILQAGRAAPQSPGLGSLSFHDPAQGWNTSVPLLAAASAMLSPTHTGSFSESLGDAFGAGARFLQKQRELEEQGALRRATVESNNLYRQALLPIKQQHEESYAQRAAALAQSDQARAAYLTAKAALAGATHATEGDILASTINSMTKQIDPTTGQPYTRMAAYRALKGIDVRQENAEAPHWSWQPGEGVDPSSGKTVPGSYRFSTRGDESPQFFPGVVQQRTVHDQQQATNQQNVTALRQQLAAQAQTAHDRALVERSSEADMRAALEYQRLHTARDPISNKILSQPSIGDSLAEIQSVRPAPAPTLATPAQTAAPAAPGVPQVGQVINGYRYTGGDPNSQSSWAKQ